MKRVIKINDGKNKYILIEEYNNFGIYQEVTPVGYFRSQSWLILKEDGVELVIDTSNNICKEEILDMIDNYNKWEKFGVKAVQYKDLLHMHKNGNLEV